MRAIIFFLLIALVLLGFIAWELYKMRKEQSDKSWDEFQKKLGKKDEQEGKS